MKKKKGGEEVVKVLQEKQEKIDNLKIILLK